MIFLDHYIFLLMIFSPLAASFFITLIPTTDTGSKITVSRFFAVLGFIAFARVLILYLSHATQTQTALSMNVINFNISLTLLLTKYNIFLYGAAASSLLVNIFLYEVQDTKTNIHQVAPFLLTFFLYVSFGQGDLRVALPILSIANFLVYFLIGFADQIRRGSTIFHMGVFLFSCDALALVLMQIPFLEQDLGQTTMWNAMFLVPGFARLGLPMLAPFIKKLLLNVDAREGPFVIVFLQLAGIFAIMMAKDDFQTSPEPLLLAIASAATISAVYVALLAIFDAKLRLMPYYFLLFYTALTSMSLFFVNDDSIWPFSLTLFLTNIACFFPATFIAHTVDKYQKREVYSPFFATLWFITLSLLLGLPGLGIGTSLWALFYRFLSLGFFYQNLPFRIFWLLLSIAWLSSLLLLSCAAIFSVRSILTTKKIHFARDSELAARRSLIFGPVVVAIISLMIPTVIFYAKLQNL